MTGKKNQPVEIPVYLFLGFLDGGKTKFIQETMEDARFNNGEKTLILLFEDGEEELDTDKFPSKNIEIHIIDSKEDMNEENLTEIFYKSKATRVLAEYNGMWNVQDFYEAMPENWMIAQSLLLVEAGSFASYNSNMRSLVVDKINNCEMVAFNRMTDDIERMDLHKIVRGISRRCEIIYDYGDDNTVYDDVEDPLPFDVNAETIEIEDRDFALWYRDLTENMKQYDKKKVRFKAVCAKNAKFPENVFVAGRHIMTCCVEDIQYCGLAVKSEQSGEINNGDWIILTAEIEIRFSKLYGKKGPILKSLNIEKNAVPPEESVATFY